MTSCLLVAGVLVGCMPPEIPGLLRTAEPHLTALDHVAAAPEPGRRDPWLAEDKLRHFAMSFAATAFAYAGARTALDPDPARLAAGTAAIAAGVGKEIHDARRGGWFSVRDMAWNLAGVATGVVFIRNSR